MPVYEEYNFDKSVNLIDPDSYDLTGLPPRKMQNFIADTVALKTLSGYAKINVTPVNIPTITASKVYTNPILSLFRYWRGSTSTKKVLAHIDTSIYELNTTTNTLDLIATGYNIVSSTVPCQWVVYNDTGSAYFCEGTALYKYTGTTISAIDLSAISSPTPKNISVHGTRLLISGYSSNPNKIYFSDAGSPETFTAGNDFDMPSTYGGTIQKHIPYNNGTLVFMSNALYYVTGDFNTPPTPILITNGIGTLSPQSIVAYQNYIFWVGNNKRVYMLVGLTPAELSSRDIGELDISTTYIGNVSAEVVDNNLWIVYTDTSGSITYNNKLLICDFRNPANPKWSGEHLGYRIRSFVKLQAQGDTGQVYFGDSVSSTLYQKTSDYYLGAGITGTVADTAPESSTFTIKFTESAYNLFSLGTEDTLSGLQITFESGSLYDSDTSTGESKIILYSTPAVLDSTVNGINYYTSRITLLSSFSTVPADGDSFEIGQIDSRYQSCWLSQKERYRNKVAHKVYINTISAGDFDMLVYVRNRVKQIADQEQTLSLLGSGAVWDSGEWDTSVWGTEEFIDDYVDFEFFHQRDKFQSIELRCKGVNRNITIYGYTYDFQVDDKRNKDGS